jgi:hypothetical protein
LRALAIVVLDPEQDVRAEQAGGAPHVFRVQDMSEVEIAGRRWSKSGSHVRRPFGWSRPDPYSLVTDLVSRPIAEL